MARRASWKITDPLAQQIEFLRRFNRLWDERRLYTRLQGIRLESRVVAGERRLIAVVTDDDASNFGTEYQLAP